MTNSEQAFEVFQMVVTSDWQNNPLYLRRVNLSRFARMVASGDNQDNYILSVRSMESEAEREQRLRITKAITMPPVTSVKKQFQKLRRADEISKEANFTNDEQTQNIQANIERFYGSQSLEDYIYDKSEHFLFNDPNAYSFINRKEVFNPDGSLSDVVGVPFEVYSEFIVQDHYNDGTLDYVIYVNWHKEQTKHGEFVVGHYYMYGVGYVHELLEYVETPPEVTDIIVNGIPVSYIPIEITDHEGKTKKFLTFSHNNGTLEVPAIRGSAFLDEKTNHRLGVTPLESAKAIFESIINYGSLKDLTVFGHTFPRRWQYVKVCNDCEGTGEGIGEGIYCTTCDGTGKAQQHSSEQSVLELGLQEGISPSDIVDLQKLVFTESVNEFIPTFLDAQIEKLSKVILVMTFNQENFSLTEVMKTATEVSLTAEEVKTTIKPLAELQSRWWELFTRVMVYYKDYPINDFQSHFTYIDFNVESEESLITKLKASRESGASGEVIRNIETRLRQKQGATVESIQRSESWQLWQPWNDQSEESINIIIANRANDDPKVVLYQNFGEVQRNIEHSTDGGFMFLTFEDQKRLIDTEVALISAQIKRPTTSFEPELNAFGG